MMRCKRAGRGNGARIANADALRPMSAFGGKADMVLLRRKCLLLTQSGHSPFQRCRLIEVSHSRRNKSQGW